MKYKSLPLSIASIVLIISLILTYAVKSPLISLLSFELFVTSAAYFLLIFSLHILRPRKIDPERIFLSGLAKPPYLHPDEIYVFKLSMKSRSKDNE